MVDIDGMRARTSKCVASHGVCFSSFKCRSAIGVASMPPTCPTQPPRKQRVRTHAFVFVAVWLNAGNPTKKDWIKIQDWIKSIV